MLQVGIVGLPNVGKSTLFNALVRGHVPVAGHPFTTVDPNVGMAEVPDARLRTLGDALRPERVVPAQIRFVDIAGLIEGAHRGEGLGNRFLAHIREVDVVLLLLRAFTSEAVPHPSGDVDPARDLEVLHTELALPDLETATASIERERKRAASSKDAATRETAVALEHAVEILDRGGLLFAELSPGKKSRLRDFSFLTGKPFLYVLNIGEPDLARETELVAAVRESVPEGAGAEIVAVCAELEAEAAELAEEEARDLLSGYGIEEPGTNRIAAAARRLLGLITFYSIESNECRAWLVPEGTTAAAAAGEIHTDMERGFIKAEVVPAERLVEAGSVAAARERGFVQAEGRDFVVRDGDVLTFRFRA